MRLPFFVYRAGRARGIENDVRIMFKNGGVACGRNDIFLGTVFVQFVSMVHNPERSGALWGVLPLLEIPREFYRAISALPNPPKRLK